MAGWDISKEIAPYTSAKMVTELKIVKCDNILSIDGSVLHTHVAEPMTTGISAYGPGTA